ncbi:response regulator [Halorubrum sp. CBA1125]|jgi:DNA-binding response OmpR family regulator|uniref:response regulator transcription factor n=1 Tax=Halorubrum sp. CBA1125 TaxID=2668072 RepID=UPI0012E8D44E|nr:response regulator [Halorubrum sp. CBA1125]MUW14347.1 response regulator [Halorubrum sp. CBA1125]
MSGTDGAANVRVLVVDDEREVADAYALRLRGYCEVETAYGGEEALAVVGESPIDIVLLDRHMPGMSGDDVLAELDERDFPGRVVMVTAVDPGLDVVEMPFADYLCKPVDREDVRAVVDQQQQILAYETLGEFFSAEAKRAVLESELRSETLREHAEYAEIAERSERLERRARRLLTDDDILEQFGQIQRENR